MTTHWKTLLDEFQNAVKEGKYEKVPYDDWRKMKQRDCWVTIRRDIGLQEVRVLFDQTTIYYTRDYPFGAFLWDKLQVIETSKVKGALNTDLTAATASMSAAIETSCKALSNFATYVSISSSFY